MDPVLGMAIGAGLNALGNWFGGKQKTTIPKENPLYVGYKNDVYKSQRDMAVKSNEIFDDINRATKQQMQDPTAYLAGLQQTFQQNAGQNMDINNQVARMKNQLQAQGIDPDSQEGMQQLNMLSNQLYNQNQQQYLNNVLGINQSGLQSQNALLNTSTGEGQNLVGNIQTDRSQQLAEAEQTFAQQKYNRENHPLTKLGDVMMGGGAHAFNKQQYQNIYKNPLEDTYNKVLQQKLLQGNLGGVGKP